MWHPLEGHLDPSGTTHAYAKAARANGAEVVQKCRVTDTVQRPDGSWDVVTEQGTVHAEHVVNAGGLWAREVGRFVGLELPVLCMAHQYLHHRGDARKSSPSTRRPARRSSTASTSTASSTCARSAPACWSAPTSRTACHGRRRWRRGISPPSSCRPISTRSPTISSAPSSIIRPLAKAGIKNVIHGPFAFAPDGNPLVGPIRGLANYWVACGVMAGFSQGGGVGLALANWMVDGDPGFDIWAMDVARYGGWASMAYTNAKVRENYGRRFRITFPNEELPAARPLRTRPLYDRFKAMPAHSSASSFGLEQALWFAPKGKKPVEKVTFRRSNAFSDRRRRMPRGAQRRRHVRDLRLCQV